MSEEPKKKFVLEFDEPPAFVFVSQDSRNEQIYLHGEIVKHWTGLELDSNVDSFTEFNISYVSAKN